VQKNEEHENAGMEWIIGGWREGGREAGMGEPLIRGPKEHDRKGASPVRAERKIFSRPPNLGRALPKFHSNSHSPSSWVYASQKTRQR